MGDAFEGRIRGWLEALTQYPDRHVGSPGNRAATALFAETLAGWGYQVSTTLFDCVEWEFGRADLRIGERAFELQVGPYSLPCVATGTLVVVDTVEALEAVAEPGAVLLLRGTIAKAQVMPKNFTFYNPESHKRVVSALESARPAAVIAATGKDPEMVGSQYPFPLFEDGDLDVPNAYMRDIEGTELAGLAGSQAHVRIDSRRVPATAEHIVATLPGTGEGRVVLFAHIDSRKGSPGALDNASGVVSLLGAAEILAGEALGLSVEIVPLNGEDNYANPGEMMWVEENTGRFGDIVLGINIDDAGQLGCATHVSFYGCSTPLEERVRAVMHTDATNIGDGPQWFQSDHAILGIYAVPAIAVASAGMHEFMAAYAHTERDTIELADTVAIAQIARFIVRVVRAVAENLEQVRSEPGGAVAQEL